MKWSRQRSWTLACRVLPTTLNTCSHRLQRRIGSGPRNFNNYPRCLPLSLHLLILLRQPHQFPLGLPFHHLRLCLRGPRAFPPFHLGRRLTSGNNLSTPTGAYTFFIPPLLPYPIPKSPYFFGAI